MIKRERQRMAAHVFVFGIMLLNLMYIEGFGSDYTICDK